jgi:hypothetical protein
MKIIEAMKKLKQLQVKAADLRALVLKNHADMSHENPVYGTEQQQRDRVAEWVQSHHDTVQEIARLRVAIQKTNLATNVTIEIGGKQVSKSIAEWIHRRKDLAKLDLDLWSQFNDRNLRDGYLPTSGGEKTETKVRRYYDPSVRDAKLAVYKSEPGVIDGHLEVVNAVTDLLEA